MRRLPLALCINMVASCWKVLGRSPPKPSPANGFLGSGACRIFISGLGIKTPTKCQYKLHNPISDARQIQQ